MAHRLSRIRGFHLHGPDGDLGHIDDFLIDEVTWQVRYLVVDTSNWIGGKLVAISPAEIRGIDWSDRVIRIDLSHDQIKHAPLMEDQVPTIEIAPRFMLM